MVFTGEKRGECLNHFKSHMGQKQSARENWTIESRASGTGQKCYTTSPSFWCNKKKIPAKYFGGQTIENDPSMRQMQRDLLAFDDTLKRGCFSIVEDNKRSKQQNYAEEYSYYQDEQYYDHNQTISN